VGWRKGACGAGIWVSMKAAGTMRADKTNHFDGIAWENRAKSPIFSILLPGLAISCRIFGIYAIYHAFFCNQAKTSLYLYLGVKMV
jgi:hypothetical protein